MSLDHLEKIKPTTHFVSKLDQNEVILYNQDAVRGKKNKNKTQFPVFKFNPKVKIQVKVIPLTLKLLHEIDI